MTLVVPGWQGEPVLPWSPSPHLADALRRLLNEWDPIGVAELVQDEYECMLAPLLGRLVAGADRARISEFLAHELEHHFGLDPEPRETDAMAERLVAWWSAAGPAEGVRGT